MEKIQNITPNNKEPFENKCRVCGIFTEQNLCGECREIVQRVRVQEYDGERRPKLSKSVKKKLWKIKGRQCEDCGLKPVTGGGNIAIHPFRTADWDGKVKNLKALCPCCLGEESKKRDKILKFIKRKKKDGH